MCGSTVWAMAQQSDQEEKAEKSVFSFWQKRISLQMRFIAV